MMTKIKFKKKKLYPNLLLGSIWFSLWTVDFILDEELNVFEYIYIACGVLYLFHFFYDLKNQYLKLENNTIQKNFLYGGWNKKFRYEDIVEVEKTYLNFILKTENDKLKVNADLIEEESYKEFKNIVLSLDLPDAKIPKLYV